MISGRCRHQPLPAATRRAESEQCIEGTQTVRRTSPIVTQCNAAHEQSAHSECALSRKKCLTGIGI